MNGFPSYRNIAAGVMVLLYLFISTPVQYWHRHLTTHCERVAPVQDSVHSLDTADAATHCGICSHSYPAFIPDAVIPNLTAGIFESEWGTLKVPVSFTAFLQNRNNKSPPAFRSFIC